LPTAGTQPLRITVGPDGNLWYTGYSGNRIGRMTPAGVATDFNLPTPSSYPYGITRGLDGNLWFVETGAAYSSTGPPAKIGRMTTSGTLTEFPIPTANPGAGWITSGPDGNIWFTEDLYTVTQVGRIQL
jgi:virginiamycin B lyase